jgi:hypothetical protein
LNVCRVSSGVHIGIMLKPRSRVVLEKLIGAELVKKSLAFYGTHKFITVFTRAGQWFQS